ncbi:crotonobetainyl-CoA--carnitine CoA-transferase [Brachybacterium sp. ACRRE]|uniref:crotonobetainyl-CoA--carnitine CoA-transferase n=1 Tax=Brachybacterium sp. ACRRE TaxID=2918184 RepID=UPI001EF293B7|nr:crotonobetainyl-CoA--carnitine CoA-transferase [Brachybacterium sp. ACRRE]MCG7307992.1 crotonobetainyl-CoA--carnitine CoA-transferase [Brachybacterium sp. ACRRE]
MSWRRRLRALVVPVRRARVLSAGPAGVGFRVDGSALDLDARPRQGAFGDCWVAAAMLAVHEAAPARIAGMIRGHDGSSSVGVLLRGGRVRIAVDRAMPVDARGRWVGALQSRSGAEAGSGSGAGSGSAPGGAGDAPGWPGLVEKAAAIHVAGSYRLLGRGLGRFGLRLLTGIPARTHVLLPRPDRLRGWLDEGRPVLASTHPLSPRVITARGPLPANHVMAIVGCDRATGEISLRNPWRPDELLVIDRRTFRRGFLSVDVTARPLR